VRWNLRILEYCLPRCSRRAGFGAQVEPAAGTWKTWVIPSTAQIRLPAPPNAAASAAEIQTIKTLMSEMTADTRNQVAYSDAGPPGYRWMKLASQQMLAQNVAAPLFTRGMALLSVAMYDATIAALDSSTRGSAGRRAPWIRRFTHSRLFPMFRLIRRSMWLLRERLPWPIFSRRWERLTPTWLKKRRVPGSSRERHFRAMPPRGRNLDGR
jgi:hypothetical protein